MDTIDVFVPADLAALRRMMNDYLQEFDPRYDPHQYWDDDYFAALLAGVAAGTLTIWLAKKDAAPIGFALVRIESRWYRESTKIGVFEEFYIAPAYRRRGLGRALAERAVAGLRAQGATAISASVVQANLEGLLFWQRIGFKIEAYHLFLLTG
jgi:ribosomal protein S18 acetylase RimI-like enzyme